MRRAYTLHLERLHRWLSRQGHLEVLRVRYNDLVERPAEEARRVSEFLGGKADVAGMTRPVDPSLYRNKKAQAERELDEFARNLKE
jgi:hypothetical protein